MNVCRSRPISTHLCLLASILLVFTNPAFSEAPAEPPKPNFDFLLEASDLVAIAQLDDTRYKTIRGFPSEGEAWLHTLFVYKGDRDIDTVVVYDKGVKGEHCYFPDTDLWQEGNRFLVFLQHTEDIMYKGLTPVCYLPVSVSSENQYILRMPANNIVMPTALLDKVAEYKFLDAGSRIDATELNRLERAELIELNKMRDEGDNLVYTRGIHISDIRKYMRSKHLNSAPQ